ncbi:MAG: type II toxin-antitoxin system Phd/YefM family antitoxin [Thermoleophilaceae bacterium]|nr:type II toxin-antitoxin system Phd/YefM family antitoxin [Thermoleophilaceae bacterium]
MNSNTVGVRDLRQNLSRYLDRARKGERVVVTERNRPIALLAPLPEDEDPIARLIAEGKVVPAKRPLHYYLDEIEPVALDDPYAGTKALEETREEPDYGV